MSNKYPGWVTIKNNDKEELSVYALAVGAIAITPDGVSVRVEFGLEGGSIVLSSFAEAHAARDKVMAAHAAHFSSIAEEGDSDGQ